MSKFDKIIKLMVENGVTTKFSENVLEKLVNSAAIIDLDFTEHDKVFKDNIAEQKNEISMLKSLINIYRDVESKLFDENQELKQRIAELESKETETCEKEPIPDDCRRSMEWYENRHQSDCIEINRLNTTIDVLIHKIEYLRQFAGLE
jgi:predicted RNase H-like nuclease (RuvC/YqgF family)